MFCEKGVLKNCLKITGLVKFQACSDTGIFLSIIEKNFMEDLWWLLISNVPQLKEKKERTHNSKIRQVGNW